MNKTAANQKGFTLIELIVVIVILGILAATALPKFADFGADARAASAKGAQASLSAVNAMVRGKFLVSGGTSTTLEGATVNFVNGYPKASEIAAAAGLNISATGDYDQVLGATAPITARISPKNAAVAANCNATFTEATAASAATVTAVTTGC